MKITTTKPADGKYIIGGTIMAKAIGYLQIAIGSTKSFTQELFTQFNGRIKDITVSSVLFLLLSTLVYLSLCYIIAGFSERPCSSIRIIRNYLLIFVRTILWIIFSAVLGVVYYTIIIEAASIHTGIARSCCCCIFGLTIYYGALFSIPPNYL